MSKLPTFSLAFALVAVVSGCARAPTQCEIRGQHEIPGLGTLVRGAERPANGPGEAPPASVRVLVVHGIGEHNPGYSKQLVASLVGDLGLEERGERRRFAIPRAHGTDDAVAGVPPALAELDVTDFVDARGHRVLEAYEITWSRSTRHGDVLESLTPAPAYRDDHDTLNRRAIDAILPYLVDVVAYAGERRADVIYSVEQSICWMLQPAPVAATDTPAAPGARRPLAACHVDPAGDYREIDSVEYSFITHSLGSDILIETLEKMGSDLETAQRDGRSSPGVRALAERLRRKQVSVFMLSNQLPLLELSRREKAAVTGAIDEYCSFGSGPGERYDERWLDGLAIAAFSDPNDVLSFEIAPRYVNGYIDSRLCPKVSNVFEPVADELSFGLFAIAWPLDAHTRYDGDPGVLSLITFGVLRELPGLTSAPTRCTWRAPGATAVRS